MADLGPVVWPPDPIRTERLVLRMPEAQDRSAIIDLYASPEVGAYIGGSRPRDELERTISEVPRGQTGQFVVDLDGAMIGLVQLVRRDANFEVPPVVGKVEIGYLFLPHLWGQGYAGEACAAALDWFSSAMPGEPVMLPTQTANGRSMRLAKKLGFTEVARVEAYGAEQWVGEWSASRQSGPLPE
jgi:RimJ/RimL family protein N-acetyltransferase